VEGVRVLSATTFSVAVAAGAWFLLMHVEKASSTDVYKIALDHLSARFMQQDTGQS
jgi:predicted secreted protein